MDYEETKKYLESLGLKYGKDFTDDTIKELTNGKDEQKDK